ncbi:MAG: hypothetical protein JWO82_4349 [Akkermansiaceae bacterium]|nr:hypothetical protein [Akkermansiaceae bacterium]
MTSTSPTPAVSNSGRLLLLRMLAFAGLALSAFLVYQKASGSVTYLHGCGAAGGCANVLGSRWSQWFGVPVAVISLLLYAAVLVFTFFPRGAALTTLGVSLLVAPLWFGGLQIFDLHQFCPWCLGAHLIGLACGVLIFLLPAGPSARIGWLSGAAGLAVLIAGQIFGPVPDTHLETIVEVRKEVHEDGSLPVHERGAGRLVTFLKGKSIRIDGLPHLGNPQAPHVMVDYFDYACDSCRDTSEDLSAAMERYSGQLCIVLLPCPINRACNPNIPANQTNVKDHAHACELARLALACWRTDPASFPAVHDALFRRPVLDPAAALALVRPLLGKPLSDAALKDPWIDEVLAADFADYKTLTQGGNARPNFVMPKLLLGGDTVIHGVMRTREVLFKTLEKEFGLSHP